MWKKSGKEPKTDSQANSLGCRLRISCQMGFHESGSISRQYLSTLSTLIKESTACETLLPLTTFSRITGRNMLTKLSGDGGSEENLDSTKAGFILCVRKFRCILSRHTSQQISSKSDRSRVPEEIQSAKEPESRPEERTTVPHLEMRFRCRNLGPVRWPDALLPEEQAVPWSADSEWLPRLPFRQVEIHDSSEHAQLRP